MKLSRLGSLAMSERFVCKFKSGEAGHVSLSRSTPLEPSKAARNFWTVEICTLRASMGVIERRHGLRFCVVQALHYIENDEILVHFLAGSRGVREISELAHGGERRQSRSSS